MENPLKYIKKYDDFEIIKVINKGTYGTVELMVYKPTGEEFAVKNFDFDQNFNAPFEVETLMTVKHPCIVKFYSLILHGDAHFSYSMEYAQNGNLRDNLMNQSLSPTEKSIIALGISYGLQDLHKRNILHLDLKPSNVLLNKNKYPLICDFGLSFTPEQLIDMVEIQIIPGTYPYIPPELLKCTDISKVGAKIDVFAFAIILYNLLSELQIFSSNLKNQLHQKDIEFNYLNDIRPSLEYYEDDDRPIIDLIEKCWQKDPDDRPSIDEVVEYLSNINNVFKGTDEKQFLDFINFVKNGQIAIQNDKGDPEETIEQSIDQILSDSSSEIDKSQSLLALSLSTKSLYKSDVIQNSIESFFNGNDISEEKLARANALFMRKKNNLTAKNCLTIADNFLNLKSNFALNYYELAVKKGSDEAKKKIQKFLTFNIELTFDQFVKYSILNADYLNEENIYEINFEQGMNCLCIAKNYIGYKLKLFGRPNSNSILSQSKSNSNSSSNSNNDVEETEESIERRYDQWIQILMSKNYQSLRFSHFKKLCCDDNDSPYLVKAQSGCPTSASILASRALRDLKKTTSKQKGDLSQKYVQYLELSVINGWKDNLQPLIKEVQAGKFIPKDIKRAERLKYFESLIGKELPFERSILFTFEIFKTKDGHIKQKGESNESSKKDKKVSFPAFDSNSNENSDSDSDSDSDDSDDDEDIFERKIVKSESFNGSKKQTSEKRLVTKKKMTKSKSPLSANNRRTRRIKKKT